MFLVQAASSMSVELLWQQPVECPHSVIIIV